MVNQDNKRLDPIRKKYFFSIEIADKISDIIFYIVSILSFAVLLINKIKYPEIYNCIEISFIITVVAFFIIGHVIRLYLTPRAEDKRREDFLSKAYGIPLNHEITIGYYNNDLSDTTKRFAAQLLENSFFSKEITLHMAKYMRTKILIYGFIWLVFVLFRNTDLAFATIAAQTIFSEQIFSKWLRIEWIRKRFEEIYVTVYKLFQSKPKQDIFKVTTLEAWGTYETTKANGAITLSIKIFNQLNPQLSEEWEKIKKTLNI